MNIYGYVRVSSIDQNEDRQIAALREVPYLKRKSLWISSQERILSDHITKSW